MLEEEETPEMLTTQEVLDRLNISRPKLYKLMKQGKIKPANYNPLNEKQVRLLFDSRDVESLLSGSSPKTHD